MSMSTNKSFYVGITLLAIFAVGATTGVLYSNGAFSAHLQASATPFATPTATPVQTGTPKPSQSSTPTTVPSPTQVPTSTPTASPTPSPAPTPTPDTTAIQNVTFSYVQQKGWTVSGYLVDTATNSSVPNEAINVYSVADNTTALGNGTTDANGYFQATLPSNFQATACQAVFSGDTLYLPATSTPVLTIPA